MSYTALPTKNPGDLLTSALWNTYLQGNADSGFMRMLADTTLGASAATIAFSSIPTTFAHLLLVGQARGDTVAGSTGLNARFNGDAGANYTFERLQGSAAAASSGSGSATTAASVAGFMAAASALANMFSPVFFLIPHYASATLKTALSMSFFGGTPVFEASGNLWASVAAINSITLLPAAGNFLAGTRFTLYGLPS